MIKIVYFRCSICLFLCGWLWLGYAGATDKVLDASRDIEAPASLTEYFSVLADPGQALTLADVQKPDIAARFKGGQMPAEALSYGFTRSAYWLRLHLRNAGDHPVERMLKIGYPLLSHVEFHQALADGGYRPIITGNAAPFSTRSYPSRHFIFPLSVPAQADQVVYLRVQSEGSPVLIPATLWDAPALNTQERNDYLVLVWYFGMATAMILFNLLLFLALKDVVYLIYVGFALSTALTVSASNGLGKEFLWPDTLLWSDMAINVGYAISIAALLLFMRRMMNTKELIPRVDRLLKTVIGSLLLLPIGYAVSLRTTAMLASVYFLCIAALILSVAIYGTFVKRQRNAVFFLVAFTLLTFGGAMAGLRTFNLQLLPTNFITLNGLLIGSALEMLLLAFALADRFNMIRLKAIADVNQANASLEERLQAREAELTESHQQLREIEHRQMLSQERQRLMQDMHDGLGSSLVGALRQVEHGRMDEAEIALVLKSCIDDLKLAIDSMEPVEADLLLLLATLRFRLDARLENSGIALRWAVNKVPQLDWLDPENALHILRILQETFTNVIKHTQATEIRVATAVEKDQVLVTVTDNGGGFAVEQAFARGGKGLANQRRRAETIGAEVSWDSSAAGTCFTLRLPVKGRAGVAEV
jgi:signal transduction histidine kinase